MSLKTIRVILAMKGQPTVVSGQTHQGSSLSKLLIHLHGEIKLREWILQYNYYFAISWQV